MPLGRSSFIREGYALAADHRRALGAIVVREGVMPDVNSLGLGIAYGNGGWNVGARPFVVASRRGGAPYSITYGAAFGYNDAAGTAWTIGAAPGSGSRIDLLWVRLTDTDSGESATGSDGPGGVARAVPVYGVTAGTAATTPVAPALPAGAVEIARVTTPSGAASIAGSTITQGPIAFLAGARAFVRDAVDRAALIAAGIHRGTQLYQLDTDTLYTYDGSTIRRNAGSYLATQVAPFANAPGQFTGTPTLLTEFTVTDPGVPYRLRIFWRCEVGSIASGTRWDSQVGIGGTGAALGTQLGFTEGVEAVNFHKIDGTELSAVLTGTTRVAAISTRAYGSAAGQINSPNRRLAVELIAA
jgi:hypothetical protein